MEEPEKKPEKKQEKETVTFTAEGKDVLSVDKLKKELEKCCKERDEFLRGWQRERADFINYKKDEAERLKEIVKFANEELIFRILDVLDNFDKAEKEIPDDLRKNQYFKGIFQIKIQLLDILKNQGLKTIESLGKKFDPNFHEVVEEVKVEKKEPGIVVEEIQKGYMLENKLLRPAKVKVSK